MYKQKPYYESPYYMDQFKICPICGKRNESMYDVCECTEEGLRELEDILATLRGKKK